MTIGAALTSANTPATVPCKHEENSGYFADSPFWVPLQKELL
jgi:hypothetical protein